MSLLNELYSEKAWDVFLQAKIIGGHSTEKQISSLKKFIAEKNYIDVLKKIENDNSIGFPKKSLISKADNQKKRTVYTYPTDENMVLKFLTFLLIRRYDYLFSPNLYSFRANHGVKEAIHYITTRRNISSMYSYKVDISNYFNSVNTDILFSKMDASLCDMPVCDFLKSLLNNPYVFEKGKLIKEEKGIMAGVPTSSFLANLYLKEMDWWFYNNRFLYARYSDDIIIFAESEEKLKKGIEYIHTFLENHCLEINRKKEFYTAPHEAWTFLGFSYKDGAIDISEISAKKLKGKMKRKSRALLRWKDRKKLSGVKAAKAFVNIFNRRLFDNSVETELTWSLWYFPIINTTKTLKEIDLYSQECIRYIATEKRGKKRFDFRYADIKNLGYKSLVHEYYRIAEETKKSRQDQTIND